MGDGAMGDGAMGAKRKEKGEGREEIKRDEGT